MALDAEQGKRMLQLLTSRYNDRHWRKKIEKTLSLPQRGVGDEKQRQIFLYLKIGLQAYKSHRADPPSWIVGGFGTQEVIERAKFSPSVIAPSFTQDDVEFLGADPGSEVDEAWWDDMLVAWFEELEQEAAQAPDQEGEKGDDRQATAEEEKNSTKA